MTEPTYQIPSSFAGGINQASLAFGQGNIPQLITSPFTSQLNVAQPISPQKKNIILPKKPTPIDQNKTPDAFKKRFIEKHGDGIAEDGRRYSQIPAPEIVAKVIRKYGDGVTTDGIPYREFLPRPASPNDPLEYRLKQIEQLYGGPKSEFYTTGIIRGQTKKEEKFSEQATNRKYEGELMKTIKSPYRAVTGSMESFSSGLNSAVADALDVFGANEVAEKLRAGAIESRSKQEVLNQDNKGLIGGIQEGSPSSIIGSFVGAIPNLLLYANPVGAGAGIVSTGGGLSLEGEMQGQTGLLDKAIAYSAGTISGLIDKISGQKFLDGLLSKGIKQSVAKGFVDKTKNFLATLNPSDFEAGTEVLQQKIENWGRQVMGTEYDKGWKQYIEVGILGKALGKVADVGFSEAPVTTLPPAAPKIPRVDAKNIETLKTIKIGKKANNDVTRNQEKGFDPYADIATHQEIVPSVDKTGLVRTTEQVQNLEDTLDPINDALTQSIKNEGVKIPLDEFLLDSMNEAKQYEYEGDSYNKYVSQIESDFEVYRKKFTDEQGRIDLSEINKIKKAKYGISNFSNLESDKANKMVGRAAKELVEKYTKGESTQAINRELSRWYSTRDLLLAMDGKTVKGGRLGKMAARVGGNIIGSYFGPLGSFAGGEISAAIQGQMMKGALRTPSGTIDSESVLSKIPKRTIPQLLPASQNYEGKKVTLPVQSQPVQESVLQLPKVEATTKKDVSGKEVIPTIIPPSSKKQVVLPKKKPTPPKSVGETPKTPQEGKTGANSADKNAIFTKEILQDAWAKNQPIEYKGEMYKIIKIGNSKEMRMRNIKTQEERTLLPVDGEIGKYYPSRTYKEFKGDLEDIKKGIKDLSNNEPVHVEKLSTPKSRMLDDLGKLPETQRKRLLESRISTYEEARALFDKKGTDLSKKQMETALRDVREIEPSYAKKITLSLEQEALKYKSAEEFVKAKSSQRPLYTGTIAERPIFSKDIINLTSNRDIAESYATKGGVVGGNTGKKSSINLIPDKLLDSNTRSIIERTGSNQRTSSKWEVAKNPVIEEVTLINNPKILDLTDTATNGGLEQLAREMKNMTFDTSIPIQERKIIENIIRDINSKNKFDWTLTKGFGEKLSTQKVLVDRVYPYLKKQGFDGISYKDYTSLGDDLTTSIWNKDIVQTKQQLLDIYNKAHAKPIDSVPVKAEGKLPAKTPQRKTKTNPENLDVQNITSKYVSEKLGRTYKKPNLIDKIDIQKAKKLADAFERMKVNDIENPRVQKSYDALAKETLEQYQYLEKAGYKIEPWEGQGQPYKNSTEMARDVADNKHLYFFKTDDGFGSSGVDFSQHPLLKDSGVSLGGHNMKYNDLLRAVHDVFGHASRGNQFGAVGEENAWRIHRMMFSDDALPALTSETRGQNSWVNFNRNLRTDTGAIIKKGEPGYIPPSERQYADQKFAFLPDEFVFPEIAQNKNIIDSIKKNGGITFDLKTGKNVRKGYAVSPYPERSLIIKGDITNKQLADWIEKNIDLLDLDGHSIGGWVDGDTIYLDVSITTKNKQKAIDLAKKYNQKAIRDLYEGVDIDTGGTGLAL